VSEPERQSICEGEISDPPYGEVAHSYFVHPVGRPAKVGPIRGEYVRQAAPTAGDKLPIEFPVCAACAVPVECTAHRVCLLSLDSLANEFTHSEELT
jgi:hypothetical protein